MTRVIPNFKLLLILILLSLLILILDKNSLLSFPKNILFFISNPISFGLYQTKKNVGNQFYFLFLTRKAGQENKALKEQIGRLLSENAALRKTLAETQSLVLQDRRMDPATYNLIPARPLGIGRYLKIDKGLLNGISLGQAVVFNENYVGRIIQVAERSANVQLLSDPDSKVAAFSQGLEDKAKGILIGQFSTEILLDKILHEEKINIDDLVYTDGTEGFLPRGLILGRVTKVLEQPTQVFKQAKVIPNFDIRDIELVFVIKE